MLYLSNPLGNLQKYFFFFCLTDVHYLKLPFFLVLNNSWWKYLCHIFHTLQMYSVYNLEAMAQFSKESCLIKNMSYYLMLFNKSENYHGSGKWAGWLDFYYNPTHLLFLLLPPVFSAFLKAATISGGQEECPGTLSVCNRRFLNLQVWSLGHGISIP